MFNNLKICKFALLAFFLACASNYVSAQDLGSSNSLFNAPNPKTKTVSKTLAKKTAAKKPAPIKAAPSVAAKKAAPKTKTVNRTAAQNSAKSIAKPAAKKVVEIVKAKQQPIDSKEQVASKQPLKNESSVNEPSKDVVVITVGQPTVSAKSDYDEFFEQAIDDGNRARDEREYTKAEAAYLRAQSVRTGDSRAVYGLGNLYSDQQRWEEAERAYRNAIQLEPSSPDAYIALSFVLTQPLNTAGDLSERYAEAEKTARQAIAIDAKNAVAFDQLGVALELRGVVGDETRDAYQKAIQLEPDFALAYAHLGRLLRRKGLTDQSSAAYRKAVALSTDDVPTMILVADVMQSQQKYLESEELLRQALRQDPKNPTALYLLGRALTTRGSFEEAEKILKKSAEVSPNSFVSYSLLGSLFLRREKFDDAEKYLMKALKVVSPNEKKRLARDFESVGDGFSRVGKGKDAARVYQQAVLLDGEKTSLTDKLAGARQN